MRTATQTTSQAAMIRSLLSRKVSAETIVKRVKKELGGKPTVGYVNAIAAQKRH
jgi:hypothetical protein